MKDEREVRKFRDDLKAAVAGCTCGCLGCLATTHQATVQIAALSWVLGENHDGDLATENAAALAHRMKAKQ